MGLIKKLIKEYLEYLQTDYGILHLYHIICICFILITLCLFYIDSIISIIILLLFTYILTGIFFICLNFDFLGYMLMIIFAGAIVILFINVLMLVDFALFKEKPKHKFSTIILHNFYFTLLILIFIPKFNLISYVINYHFDDSSIESHVFNHFLVLKQGRGYFLFNTAYTFIKKSTLYEYCIFLYKFYWIETLLIGLILILAIVCIIIFFKKIKK
jgi:NADH:ubiquinone oxidoreductase subunit 6 (subunit J)